MLKKIVGCCLALFIASCASVPSQAPPAASGSSPVTADFRESGKASFYALKYQFRRTASGERYSHFAKTAAHRTLPFGARVIVTNIDNGRSVVVRINDRGPFVAGRVIDLSRSAFSDIADTSLGLIDVEIELVD